MREEITVEYLQRQAEKLEEDLDEYVCENSDGLSIKEHEAVMLASLNLAEIKGFLKTLEEVKQ